MPSLPAEEHIAVLSVEVPKFLLGEASKLLSLQHKSFHAVQVLVPLLHQLFSLERSDKICKGVEDKKRFWFHRELRVTFLTSERGMAG